MLEAPEIPLSQKTLRSPHKDGVSEVMGKKNFLGRHSSEQQARNEVASKLRKLRKDPLFKVERKKHFETEKARQELERVSIIDPLTGLYNQRFLNGDPVAVPPKKGILEREIERILKEKSNNNLTVAMLDIDRFKGINDKFGHPIGDEVLKKVAQTILEHIRSDMGDFAIRYGGEEFLIITPNGLDIAKKMIERIRTEIEKIQFNNDKYPKSITISCGMTNLTEEEKGGNSKKTAEAMIKRADSALYKSKAEGRNQTTVVVLKTDGVKYTKITL